MSTISANKTGWDAWSPEQATAARANYHLRTKRLQREKQENDARLLAKAQDKLRAIQKKIATSSNESAEQTRKKAIIEAAIARASVKAKNQ